MSAMPGITPVDTFTMRGGEWFAKRDDLACYTSADMPSGSKVRQYEVMAKAQPGVPMLVGCSSFSAMQIYVAAAAKQFGVPGHVFTAGRGVRSDATAYAKKMGAKLHEVYPGGYLNVLRARAKAYADKRFKNGYVHWDENWAVTDAAQQLMGSGVGNHIKRIVIPSGSGLIAAGVLAGLARMDLDIPVLSVAVSPMADVKHIKSKALNAIIDPTVRQRRLPRLRIVRSNSKYEQWRAAILPDGTPLDPYYSAKALPYVKPGDLLWLPGLRPLCSMPGKCQDEIKRLQDNAGKPNG